MREDIQIDIHIVPKDETTCSRGEEYWKFMVWNREVKEENYSHLDFVIMNAIAKMCENHMFKSKRKHLFKT